MKLSDFERLESKNSEELTEELDKMIKGAEEPKVKDHVYGSKNLNTEGLTSEEILMQGLTGGKTSNETTKKNTYKEPELAE